MPETYACVKTDRAFDLFWVTAVICELKQEGKLDLNESRNLLVSAVCYDLPE